MTDELDGLLARVADSALREDLRAQIDRVRAKRSFGLVFESHLPERVQLPNHPIRVGSKVVVRDDSDSPTFQVSGVAGGTATLRVIGHADGSRLTVDEATDADEVTYALADLVVTADFDDPIYPGLGVLGSVNRGGDKPAQVVIKGENHHVLQALRFTHAGKVDCIYIDPPYNTGAKDWKYDNNYVDDTDAYRHSKWLAFMERRLLVAKELLNPECSVLIVTIDAREHLRLGLLLEQTFPGCSVQMASIVINPSGAGNDGVNRVDEYAFFVSVGEINVPSGPDDMLNDADAPNARVKGGLSWESFLRSGTTWYRSERPNLCYPIFIKAETGEILGAGEPLQGDDESARVSTKDGCSLAWPIRRDGRLGIWRRDRAALESLVAKGYAYASARDEKRGTWSIKYLLDGTVKLIESGQVDVTRSGSKGQVEASRRATIEKVAKSVWFRSSHNAGKHGSDLVRTFLPGRKFPFPKSLYAVEDALRFCVGDNPDAVVLDFFAGSGTTAHAVARLNRQDGGRRQSILVTNNEVSPAEAKTLRAAGHRPGDAEWEALGIFEHITRPRISAAVTGRTPEGDPIKGDYKFTDEFPMADGFDENVVFAELTYQDADDIALDLAFEAIAPMLWLRAGGQGPIIETCLDAAGRHRAHVWAETYGILFNPDRWRSFIAHVPEGARVAYVVTDSASVFAEVAAELPAGLEVVRLYENYLTTFRIGGTTSGGVG